MILLAALFSLLASAEVVVEDFSTRTRLDSGSAVWNQALGVLHPTLQITNYNGANPPLPMNVGTGSEGSFEPSTYSQFGTVVGNTLYIDTDDADLRVIEVTSFLLEENWVLEPTGSRELIIRSLSDVVIRGEIWCHGQDAVGQIGGEGRCGGKRGGDGGNAGLAGDDGEDSTAPVTGGMGGAGGVANRGGGGGGSWNLTSLPANGTGFAGGAGAPEEPGERGVSSSDPTFTNFAGGAGGGGGGGGTAGVNNGGGGGGGGGVVYIEAARDFVLGSLADPLIGFIYANGGNGSDQTGDGGPGAGGGGGGVFVAVGGTIYIHNNSGVAGSQAVGGRNPAPIVGAAGGIGRSFFSSIGYSSLGFYDPSEELPVGPGTVEFVGPTMQDITSKSFDLGNTLAEVTALTPSPASGDFTIYVAGSNDDFASDDTGFTTDLTMMLNKRYLKFKVEIRNSTPAAPTMMTSLTVSYTPGLREKFDFKAAGCGRVDTSLGGGMWLLLLPLILLLALRMGIRPSRRF